jgi:uncharacterized protein with NRDE domain
MCLLVFSFRADATLALVANRDESYDRPTAPLDFWADDPEILAGRDLRAGGTWLAVHRTGRVAALTNFRRGAAVKTGTSRGELPADFARSKQTPEAFLDALAKRADRYSGFSLVVGVPGRFFYFSNLDNTVRQLQPGSHALSNHLLDTPWPKVVRAKAALDAALASGPPNAAALCDLLLDQTVPPDADLPDTGVGLALERMLAPSFIVTPDYGTRSTTALVIDASGAVDMYEKNYGRGGRPLYASGQHFQVQRSPLRG